LTTTAAEQPAAVELAVPVEPEDPVVQPELAELLVQEPEQPVLTSEMQLHLRHSLRIW
jgi:hypothetical protein